MYENVCSHKIREQEQQETDGDKMQRILQCNDPEKMMKVAVMLIESGDDEMIILGEMIKERALFIGVKHVDHIINHFPFPSR